MDTEKDRDVLKLEAKNLQALYKGAALLGEQLNIATLQWDDIKKLGTL
jgi:hypothetical protein